MKYLDAGVDITAGETLVAIVKRLARSTHRSGVTGAIGGFGAIFDVKAAGFIDPLLVLGTDGVGTKLKVAIETNSYNSIGIDLVAMCVNDLLVQGATPLAFLDYFATGKLDLAVATAILQSIAHGCREANCALIGGETAEMPGLYHGQDLDLAGFALGAVERDTLLPRALHVGDVLLGLASSGVHANGFSLLRQVMQHRSREWDEAADFAPKRSFADVFLTPTRIYTSAVLALHAHGLLQGLAHITGGGLPGNLPRVLPDGLGAIIDQSWPVPPEFHWLAETGSIDSSEMLQTFNCGIGLVLIIRPDDVERAISILADCNEKSFPIGRLDVDAGLDLHINLFDQDVFYAG